VAKITLITGGARSGKSRYGQLLAERYAGERFFVATAQPFDMEMKERIARHRSEREDRFITIEEPLDLAAAVGNVPGSANVILIDCLSVWLGNLLHAFDANDAAIAAATGKFIAALDRIKCDAIVVTNEVGMGIVPENALARRYRDLAGNLNRDVAAKSDNVYLCVCGLPVAVKRSL
jgi:adenosylcobinamide kinase/adenosylcobinamide-phosphate guanylyltransferase